MNQEYYKILEVDENATDEEIKASYERLKAKYNEDKWLDGEEGNEAARRLDKLEVAYNAVMDERRESTNATGSSDAYAEVTQAIKAGDLSKAQDLLDAFNERTAEWHYLQSVVFYKKNWLSDSKKQLEIALQMDPTNQKYRNAHDNLLKQMDYTSQAGGVNTSYGRPVEREMGGGGNWCSTCATMCYTYLCMNCLFNLCCGCH